MRYIIKAYLSSFVISAILIGGLLPRLECAPDAATPTKLPITRLNEAQAVETARAFCRKIGQPINIPGTAKFGANSLGPPGHYWLPVWDVDFPGKVQVEVADATGVIANYMNIGYRGQRGLERKKGDPPDNDISKEEAFQRAQTALDATGQKDPLQVNGVELMSFAPDVTHSYSWEVSWKRVSNGIPYWDQHINLGMDAETGEITGLAIMFPTPPLGSVMKRLKQEDAIATAASQVISQYVQQEAIHKETHLEIVVPDSDWGQRHGLPGSTNSVRLAWASTFIVDGLWRLVNVDTETGEILSGDAYDGPAGVRGVGLIKRPDSLPVSQMLQNIQIVCMRKKEFSAGINAKPFLQFSSMSQPHAVSLLTKIADFHKQAPAQIAAQEMVLVNKSHAIGVYSYFPDLGIVGSGTDWATLPSEFSTWIKKKLISNVGTISGITSKKY